jgi:hypothetical protein
MASDILRFADQAEAESMRRFIRLRLLWRTVDEAIRRAEAQARLESALRYMVPSPVGGRSGANGAMS